MHDLKTSDLSQFTGSTEWFRHSFNRAVIYTEGVKYVADHGGAHWLVDAIASHVVTKAFKTAAAKDGRISTLHFWKLAVHPDRTAKLAAVADSDEPAFIEQAIPYTDFPLDEISIWAANDGEHWTLLLPTEY